MKEFCIIKIQRVSNGVRVYCKSEKLEKLFRLIAEMNGDIDRSVDSEYWEGAVGYKIYSLPKSFMPFVEQGIHFMKWGDELILNEYEINLSFLKAIGLSNGIEFIAKGVYSTTDLQRFLKRANTTLQKIYDEFFKEDVSLETVIG